MPGGSGSRAAWAFAGATALLSIAGLTILALTLDEPPKGGWGFRGFPTIFALASGTVGWLIMIRRPANRIGLVLAVIGVLNGAQLFLTEYAAAGQHQELPASNVLAWVNAFIWVPTLGLMAGVVPLLFPDGRLPSARWRPVAALIGGGGGALVALIAIYPDAVGTPRFVRKIIDLPVPDVTVDQASYVALAIYSIAIVLASASLVLRWRRADGVVREQLKWLALAATIVVACMPFSVVENAAMNATFILAIGTVPVAVGIAVLRYRLYEIDTVINRTLVFGALTAILTGAFAALQKLLQTIFVEVTGDESDAATIITTLVLATSFVPLKKALEKIAEKRLRPDPGHAAATAEPSDPDALVPAAALASPSELETLLRRVVREELRAIRDE